MQLLLEDSENTLWLLIAARESLVNPFRLAVAVKPNAVAATAMTRRNFPPHTFVINNVRKQNKSVSEFLT